MGGNICVLDSAPQPIEEFYKLATKYGIDAMFHRTDVTNEAELSDSFDHVVENMSSIDGLVTAAGIAIDKPFVDYTWAEVRKILDVNVIGTFFCVQQAAKQMIRQGRGGSIVLISSICATTTAPGHKLSAYHSSKGAIKMLNTALSVELGQYKIRVNSISPGYIESDMTRKMRDENPALTQLMHSTPPLQRIGRSDDLTGALIYLLGDTSQYTTGSDTMVTGGLHAGRSEQ
ncbi:putative oxido YohF [Cyphellophora attinorum]|uniref:Putative oxido YohF n=1 Tax=Cyphellophora attinorum TaxID=1664694 RepID=A0A0N1GZ90_9EURO|nr:putative oxido YohF [Phialophora attinorum]KPI36284.1 putative oxido YohF [Phialophora attinorum]